VYCKEPTTDSLSTPAPQDAPNDLRMPTPASAAKFVGQAALKSKFCRGRTVDSGIWLADVFEQALTIASDHAPVGAIQQHAAAQLIARKVYGRPQGAAQRPKLVHLILGQLEVDGHRALCMGSLMYMLGT